MVVCHILCNLYGKMHEYKREGNEEEVYIYTIHMNVHALRERERRKEETEYNNY